ncbi:MAG TPA: PEP-CTERM sorting domain-containing protein [Chthoniobacterales bacterium]
MKTRLSLAVLMAASLCALASGRAQEVRYDLTGTYPDTTPTTSLTAPGGAFDFRFLVPESVPNAVLPTDPFFVGAPILSGSYTFGGSAASVSSGTYSFSDSANNQTFISLNASVGKIELFATNDDLFALASRPDASGQSHFITGDLGTRLVDAITFTPPGENSFSAPDVTVSVVGASVPEPSSVGFLAVGLICWGGIAFMRHRCTV